jgi:hypothetical protein
VFDIEDLMSIVRQLIQIAMVEAVSGKTIAGRKVFDSRMDTLDLIKGAKQPFLIFSVEESSAQGDSFAKGLIGRTAKLTVLVQAAVASGCEVRSDDDDRIVIMPAIGETDSAYEASLNILDRQWRHVLHGFESAWGNVFCGLVTSIGVIKDVRSSDPETGVKSAARFTQFDLDVMPDPAPGDDIPAVIEAGLALLEGDGDVGYRALAAQWRQILALDADWPDWRAVQSSLFATDGDMAALAYGPDGVGSG